MANPAILKKAIDAITVMNVAVTNIRLYPPSSAIIRNTVDRVHQLLTQILVDETSVILAESGSNFVICGHLFDESDQKRHPQTASFLEMLNRFGLRSLSFERRLAKSELKTFLQVISRNPAEVEAEGGLREVIGRKKLPNILLDHKVYVVVDKDQQIVAGIGVRDEDIVKYLTGFGEMSETELRKIREMARDPKWVTQVFRAGMSFIMRERGQTSYRKLSEVVGHMIRTLDDISDEIDREKVCRELAAAIVEMDDEMMALILTQEVEGMFGESLFDHVIDVLGDDKFERIAARIQQMGDGGDENEDDPASRAYRYLMKSGKGRRLRDRIRRRQTMERRKRERRMAILKDGLTRISRKDMTPFLETEFAEALSEYARQLVASGRSRNIRALLEKLSGGLSDERADIREKAAAALVSVGRPVLADGRMVPMAEAAPRWLDFVRNEPRVSESYAALCRMIQELTREMIRAEVYEESEPILDVFHRIRYRGAHPEPEARELAGEVLREIAANDVLDHLLEEFQSGTEEHRRQAIRLLGLFGEASMDRLLDLLEESRDMSVRVRILQVLSEIGTPAPDALARRIEKGGPWYYLRNLILMLGKVGRKENLRVLKPLLKHEDFRVRRETLNSIYNIGEDRRGEILVDALSADDDRLRLNIVDMLGALGYRPAARPLMELIEDGKSFFSAKISDQLQEKICTALGRIGAEEAVPLLGNIAGQKGLLGLRAFPDSVREAAAHALADIGRSGRGDSRRPTLPEPESVPPGRKLTLPGVRPRPAKAAEVLSTDLTLPAALGDRIVKRNDDTVEENVVDMLMGAIRESARAGDFERAEALRQQLVELDGLALSEIIQAGEIIERERGGPAIEVDADHLGIWPELYDALTPEESEALLEALVERVFQSDETVFRQGEPESRLFFVHGGKLKLVFVSGERENLLKTAGKGDIVGEDTFFGISVCTTSLVALGRSRVSFLDRRILESWRESHPALESKLHDYCLRLERIQDIIRNKGLERRKQERFSAAGVVDVQLLGPSGTPTGKVFKGNLRDISVGGISFGIRSPNRKNISLLLGRNLEMRLDFPAALGPALGVEMMLSRGGPKIRIKHVGTVIGVSHMAGEDYAVHIQFDSLLGGDPEEEAASGSA
jgi:HEAT repeat protein/CRP-like cAMP-binding protein